MQIIWEGWQTVHEVYDAVYDEWRGWQRWLVELDDSYQPEWVWRNTRQRNVDTACTCLISDEMWQSVLHLTHTLTRSRLDSEGTNHNQHGFPSGAVHAMLVHAVHAMLCTCTWSLVCIMMMLMIHWTHHTTDLVLADRCGNDRRHSDDEDDNTVGIVLLHTPNDDTHVLQETGQQIHCFCYRVQREEPHDTNTNMNKMQFIWTSM